MDYKTGHFMLILLTDTDGMVSTSFHNSNQLASIARDKHLSKYPNHSGVILRVISNTKDTNEEYDYIP